MPPGGEAAQPRRRGDAGFTLVEVVVAVGLFGLIAMAGFTLLDSELGVQARTDGRLERLGDMQRAMYVLSADFEQMSSEPAMAGSAVSFRRLATGSQAGEVEVSYSLDGQVLVRTLAGRPQRLIDGVSTARWSFYSDAAGWAPDWPQEPAAPRPTAAALDITLTAGPDSAGGTLRRVVAMPDRP